MRVIRILLEREGKILLVEVAKRPGQWELLGGKGEQGETDFEVAVRELREETGILMSEDRKLYSSTEWSYPDTNEVYFQRTCFVATKFESLEQIQIPNKEILSSRWFGTEELNDVKIDHYSRRFILRHMWQKRRCDHGPLR